MGGISTRIHGFRRLHAGAERLCGWLFTGNLGGETLPDARREGWAQADTWPLTAEASKLVYILGQIGRVLEVVEIETRLKALEVARDGQRLPAPR